MDDECGIQRWKPNVQSDTCCTDNQLRDTEELTGTTSHKQSDF